jgi:predicted nucleic acid-binding protein
MRTLALDTGVLIRHLRNDQRYTKLVDRLADEGDIHISSFTRLEIVRGMRETERKITFELLNSMITLPMDAYLADFAGELILAWRQKGIALGDADAVIAATALHYDLDLVTTNTCHFPMPELRVWQVDEMGQIRLREQE